ncbi:MAG: phenylacetate--CoA ligase [Crocinitomicaceae bacterium]|mgnify:CR=1 FL=1|nr:phenylacetate--CoA ligase [Crocinitomicaceae bacterium]|tara:strand:+ start:4794 stop:6116 length:1323 start_codon:yes stop_codon:yes gene_type:complete
MSKEDQLIGSEFYPEIEYSSVSDIRTLQNEKLMETIKYVSENSPFYKRKFQEWNIDPKSIKTLEDLQRIPITTKDDLNNYNFEFLCVPRTRVIDYVTTSGTLGDPVTFAMTNGDLERLALNEALSYALAGCNEEDIVQLMTTIDKRFMAGLAYFLGAKRMNAGIVRVGSGVPELHWDTINRIKPTVVVAVPSFILKLIGFAEKNGIDFRNSSIKKAICIGEPLRNQDFSLNTLGEKIKEKWDIKLYSTYASTEMSTAFTECEHGRGGHHHPGLIIPEFVDEEGKHVGEGEIGELVFTTVGVEGMPLLRFKTGDLVHHYSEKCLCGRTTLRVGPVLGRKKQMIKLKGTTVYPPAIFDILNKVKGVSNYVVEVYTSEIGTDELLIHIGSSTHSDMFEHELKTVLGAKLRVTPKIAFLPIDKVHQMQFPEMSRKPILFLDNRK